MPDLTVEQLCALLGVEMESIDDHLIQLRIVDQSPDGSAQLPRLEAGQSAANLAEARSVLVYNLSRYTFTVQLYESGQPGGAAGVVVQVAPLTWVRVPGYWHSWEITGAQQAGAAVPPSQLVMVVCSKSRGPFEFGQLAGDQAAGLAAHDSHSGAYGAAATDTAIILDRPSAHVEVWNRDSSSDVWFNFDQATSRGGTDYHLKPGEYWHGQVRASVFHYQGGQIELQVWG